MKKTYLLLFSILWLVMACNKGSINGYVTYQLSEFGSPAVDQYAEIYITKDNVDTIADFLTVVRLQEQIERHKKDTKRTNNKHIIDSLQQKIEENKQLIANKISNKNEFLVLSDRAMRNLIQIKENKRNYKELVDNEGMYSTTIKAGNYHLVAISETIKKENFLERHGKIIIKNISISKSQQIKVNINFQ